VTPVITLPPTTARRALQAVLRGSGLLAVATGTWVVARGSAAVPDGDTVSPSTDSVLRFYATWWAGAGVLMWRLAAAPERHPAAVRAVAVTTFVGGLARLLAARHSGPPHPLFRALTVLELVAPPALLAAQRQLAPHQEEPSQGR
jgi:hypothetical protein